MNEQILNKLVYSRLSCSYSNVRGHLLSIHVRQLNLKAMVVLLLRPMQENQLNLNYNKKVKLKN